MVGLVLFSSIILLANSLRFIVIINYYTGTAVLVLWLLAKLLHPCM
jgi:hypothetical protein